MPEPKYQSWIKENYPDSAAAYGNCDKATTRMSEQFPELVLVRGVYLLQMFAFLYLVAFSVGGFLIQKRAFGPEVMRYMGWGGAATLGLVALVGVAALSGSTGYSWPSTRLASATICGSWIPADTISSPCSQRGSSSTQRCG